MTDIQPMILEAIDPRTGRVAGDANVAVEFFDDGSSRLLGPVRLPIAHRQKGVHFVLRYPWKADAEWSFLIPGVKDVTPSKGVKIDVIDFAAPPRLETP